MKNVFLFILILLSISYYKLNARQGGPDEFGYRFIDSNEAGGPEFDWFEINWIGVSLGMHGSADDETRSLTLPEPFNFYGIDYNQINICSNGWVNFGPYSGGSRLSFPPLPEPSDPNALVCMFALDLYPRSSPGEVYYYYDMVQRIYVVEFFQIIEYSSGLVPFTFEAIFDFNRKSILLQYLVTGPMNSHTAEIGIENETGTVGLHYGDHTAVHDGSAILFVSDVILGPPSLIDFETPNSIEGFVISDSTIWEFGTPTSGPERAYSGDICFGTNLNGAYPNLADAYIVTPIFNLGGMQHPWLDFYHWYSMDLNMDGGNLQITTDDGLYWQTIYPESSYPVSSITGVSGLFGQPAFSGFQTEWTKVYFNLSTYAGNLSKLRFHFASDGDGIVYPGWYIDDVSFYEEFGVLKGNVSLLSGSSNAGVIVSIPVLNKADTTDESGFYRFDSLKTGTYRLEFSRTRYSPQFREPVNITRFDTTTVDIMMYPELYYANFEADSGDLRPTPSTGGWQWGTVGSDIPPYSAVSGTHLWGTNLTGRYANNSNYILDLYTSLHTIEHPGLEYWQWYQFDGEYEDVLFDGGNVKISTDDGITFTVIYPASGYDGTVSSHNTYLGNQPAFGGNGNYWHMVAFDLTPYAFQPVIIRFETGADGSGTAYGWYIDDIRITEYSDIKDRKTPEKFDINIYPNPFNSYVSLSINSDINAKTNIDIFNINGEKVYSKNDIVLTKGINKILWDSKKNSGEILPTGIYFINMKISDNIINRKVVLIK